MPQSLCHGDNSRHGWGKKNTWLWDLPDEPTAVHVRGNQSSSSGFLLGDAEEGAGMLMDALKSRPGKVMAQVAEPGVTELSARQTAAVNYARLFQLSGRFTPHEKALEKQGVE
ncbi:hypothetical protein Y1Q_0023490 [Alligator mississippiensis]|uniref:Uncharacterized protein n=1 Tax=Alligator mississippiensis TaxID=8496 RepID=A0A151NPR2_ALLMI|nr:hypothetical protein Y1Q_0023490 [Alligator mississippiensis]